MASSVAEYLKEKRVPYELIHHPAVIPAQQLAAVLHVTGGQLAKPVVLQADDRLWMAVVPATLRVDEHLIQRALEVQSVRLATEAEFKDRFPDCELGAEPPLGSLYRIPMILDQHLTMNEFILFRAGTHQEVVRMRYSAFAKLERPLVAAISHAPAQRRWGVRWQWEEPAPM